MGTPNRSCIVSRTIVLLVILFHSPAVRPPLCIWPEFLCPKYLLNSLVHLKLGISSVRSPCSLYAIYSFNPFSLPSHLTSCPSKWGAIFMHIHPTSNQSVSCEITTYGLHMFLNTCILLSNKPGGRCFYKYSQSSPC